MKGKIVSYRRGRHSQYQNQALVRFDDVESREGAQKLVGKKVVWKSVEGIVTRVHGANGVVRVHFKTSLPGQAIGSPVMV